VKLKGRFLSIINQHRIVQTNPNTNGQSAPIFQLPPQQARLPEFELPKFDGEIENFAPFKELFMEMVSKKPISKIEKLMYLKNSCQGGKAEDFLEIYQLIGDNFDIAWSDLCKRYDNPRLLADKQFSELLECESVAKENAQDLRKLINCYSIRINQLQQTTMSTDTLWNLMLVHLATWRLDDDLKKAWEDSLKQDELPTWEKLEKFLNKKCQVLENVQQTSRPIQVTSQVTVKANNQLRLKFVEATVQGRQNVQN
jgi:hypothetical protein